MAEREPRLGEHELALLESLLEEATPGPWRFEEDSSSGRWLIQGAGGERLFEEPRASEDGDYAGFDGSQADFRLVAATRVALPRLLTELRRLHALLRRVHAAQTDVAGEVSTMPREAVSPDQQS